MVLLHIEASPKGEYSYSSQIAQSFLAAYKRRTRRTKSGH